MAEVERDICQYQKYLDKCLTRTPDDAKLVKVFRKLEKLGVTIDHLQSTGIGKTVNSYRKHEGEVGKKARELVGKWKDMVSRETSPAPVTAQTETGTKASIPSIQCETVSETHYRSAASDTHQRAPYMCSLPASRESPPSHSKDSSRSEKKDKKKHENSDDAKKRKTETGSDTSHRQHGERDGHAKHSSSHHSSHRKRTDGERADQDSNEKVGSVKSSSERTKKHKRDEKSKESSRDSSKSRSASSKERQGGGETVEKYLNPNPAKVAQNSHSQSPSLSSQIEVEAVSSVEGEMPVNTSTAGPHYKQGSSAHSKKEKGDKEHTSKVKVKEESGKRGGVDSEEEEDEDNQGMSFEDLLNYDANTSVKRVKKKTTVMKGERKEHHSRVTSKEREAKKSASQVSKEKEHRHKDGKTKTSRSSHEDKHRERHRHSNHKETKHGTHHAKHKDSHNKASSNQKQRDEDRGLKRKAEDQPAIRVPEPPKQVRLSTDDIMSSMPDLTTNYHPLPRPKLPEDSPLTQSALPGNGEDVGSKRHSRTAVYSGKKSACYLTGLDYVGGVPYEILHPVLEVCSPTQLYSLEDANPQFVGETDSLWQRHCSRDFRSAQPGEFESWRELYLRKHDEREDKLKNLTASISATINKTKTASRTTKLAYVDVQAKAPRGVRRQQLKHGTGGPAGKLDPLSRLSSRGGGQDKPRPPVARGPSPSPSSSSGSSLRGPPKAPKIVAPMMAKTLRFMKSLKRK